MRKNGCRAEGSLPGLLWSKLALLLFIILLCLPLLFSACSSGSKVDNRTFSG